MTTAPKIIPFVDEKVNPKTINEVASLFTTCFSQDPFYRWMTGDTSTEHIDPDKLHRYFTFLIKLASYDKAQINLLYVGDDLVGATLWEEANQHMGRLWSALKAGLVPVIWRLGAKAAFRFIWEYPNQVKGCLDRAKFDAKDHKTLVIIVVSPKAQGKGYANLLIAQLPRPIRLDSTSDKSMQFYQKRHGYGTIGTVFFGKGLLDSQGLANSTRPKDGVPLYCMSKL